MAENLDFLGKDCENIFYVIDRKVYEIYREELFCGLSEQRLYLLDALEENKRMDTVLEICGAMAAMPSKRNTGLVSVGGGIVQDVTGFVANILYRGIGWTFVPTTLLSACDSCIGGKTSLNCGKLKNLLGTFYPPMDIYICPSMFKTLEEKDFLSGMGEVAKFNIMGGELSLSSMEKDLPDLLRRDSGKLAQYVQASLEFKKRIIEEDEFDRGARVLLNYGHTFGHAIETVTGYAVPHGTAVALGMVMANRISLGRKMVSEDLVARMEKLVKQIVRVDGKEAHWDADAMEAAIHKDKKQTDSHITAILMDSKQKLHVVHDIKPMEIADALRYLSEIFLV